MDLLNFAILLACFFNRIEGATKVMPHDPSDTSQSSFDDIASGSGDFASGSDGSGENEHPCYTSGNFTFPSIADILHDISSNNYIVNITIDVVLASKVTLEGLENITIIGHRNPVVQCNDVGAVKFISCKNVTIEGIQWEGCGCIQHPGIEFYNSSDVSFEKCSFHNSKGRSILLSGVSGDVYISTCNFTHNYKYSGHGAAVHYTPNTSSHYQHKFMIQSSNFIFYRATESVVYIDGSSSRIPGDVYLQDSVFVNNTGVPLYISHSNLELAGCLLFKGNTVKTGGVIYSSNSNIFFHDQSTVNFICNSAAVNGGALYQVSSRTIFGAESKVTFKDNIASVHGGAIYSNKSHITFDGNSSVIFSSNEANNDGGAIYCTSFSDIIFDGNSSVTFTSNEASDDGGAVYCWSSYITFDANSSVTFNNNEACDDGGAVFCDYFSDITFDGNSSITFNSNKASSGGGAVFCEYSSHITFDGNSSITFINNTARKNGGAVRVICLNPCPIKFKGNSIVTFDSNNARDSGGAIHSYYSPITFDCNSIVTFNNNKASANGGAVLEYSSNITFNGNSRVAFKSNKAKDHGGAVYGESVPFFSNENSHSITLYGHSRVIFSGNEARSDGGAVYYKDSAHIVFHGNTNVTFTNNKASDNGGAIYCEDSANIIFDGNSRLSVMFSNNNAKNGGAVYCEGIIFDGNSSVTIIDNEARDNGGGVYCISSSHITFKGNSSLTIVNNDAKYGGAVYCKSSFHITFEGNSSATFNNNKASDDGGAVYCESSSHIIFDGNSSVIFNNNEASYDGGAVFCKTQCHFLFHINTSVIFTNNSAINGGSLLIEDSSYVSSKGNSNVYFLNNEATLGGAIYIKNNVTLSFKGSCMITFGDNRATESGGALYLTAYSFATLTDVAEVIYSDNKVTQYGGAIYCSSNSNITLNGNIAVKFTNNTSNNGGALSILQSIITIGGNTSVTFTGNNAENGGAISVVNSSLTFVVNSKYVSLYNSFTGDGNSSTVNISSISFLYNSANQHGGAIYCDLTKSTQSKITFDTSDVVFNYNTDLTGSDVYIDAPTSCDEMCVNNSIINKRHIYLGGIIKTSPRKLVFNNSAVTCIDNGNDTNCQTYLTQNIMLGQKIIINACVLDLYNQRTAVTQFVLTIESHDHHITGPNNVLISCALFKEVSIKGKRILETTNYSIVFTSYDGSKSDMKKFSTVLITELSPCHPGFHYDNTTQTCVCYSDSDIVSCSGSTSSIKRGYWFGEVNDIATVAVCPKRYCNFRCETANGFFKLSPVRANQCNSRRSGPACGSCKEGYTLSFDSIECVSVDKCTTGQTVLVVTLSILYWVVVVILVFIVTYYHNGIGYLYAITYYYSMVVILLGGHLYISQGLFTFVNVISSIAKVTPQFLGELCLVTNMSGIDQQFIHYIHPLAVAIIIIIICLSARISYKFSSFVHKGIIHVICFLLLLSYTSVATTSLLLLRSLTFENVDKVYTYLSPDLEYFHGRHLPYVLTAILCTLVIVIGLPLLLLLEPFLNHKINFTRIKPLLDQFQGCYKDKYRSFAAYYMICRLVIILIIIANPSNSDISQFVLIISNSSLALIHVTSRPYRFKILNVFDGLVLQLMILVSMVPLIDSYDHYLLLIFMFVLVLLPKLAFLIMEIYLHKETVKKITTYCVPPKPNNTNVVSTNTVEDRMMVKAKIKQSNINEYTHYRESFMEAMDEIEDCDDWKQ